MGPTSRVSTTSSVFVDPGTMLNSQCFCYHGDYRITRLKNLLNYVDKTRSSARVETTFDVEHYNTPKQTDLKNSE